MAASSGPSSENSSGVKLNKYAFEYKLMGKALTAARVLTFWREIERRLGQAPGVASHCCLYLERRCSASSVRKMAVAFRDRHLLRLMQYVFCP